MINRLGQSRQHFSSWLALTAVLVLLVGKSVHLGQECGDDCCSPVVQAAPESLGCSCCHHSHSAAEDESDRESQKGHDEHQCPVCSVLSHVTECPIVIGLPDEAALVTSVAFQQIAVGASGPQLPSQPRGPPQSA